MSVNLDPLLLTVEDAVYSSAMERSSIYRRLETGGTSALKVRWPTKIDIDALRGSLRPLPAAVLRRVSQINDCTAR